ncbi:hypothetical protein [Oceanithermus profundus]|nr:hypothetical protein [Oceanithermus profundus]
MRRALAGAMLAALALAAAPQARLPAAAVWIEVARGGVYALTSAGTVWRLEAGGAVPLAGRWRPGFLTACGPDVLAVSAEGRLGRPGAPWLSNVAVAPDARPACRDGRVFALGPGGAELLRLDGELRLELRRPAGALPDAQPVWVEGPQGAALALLTGPTARYRHGVLGDGVEAEALTLFDPETLEPVAAYRPGPPAVLEQLRALPAGPGRVLVTRSHPDAGAGLVLLAWSEAGLEPAAEGRPMGRAFRWLNAFAAAPDRVYAVHTPHIGGPLAVYVLPGLGLRTHALGVTAHALGSRNLDLAVRLGRGAAGDVLVLAGFGAPELVVVDCGAETCRVRRRLPLPERIASNLAYAPTPRGWRVYAGGARGGVFAFEVAR